MVESVFYFQMWHHLAGNFRKARNTVGYGDKPVGIESTDIPGDVPALGSDDFARLFWVAQITHHYIRPFHLEHPFPVRTQDCFILNANDSYGNARQRVTNRSRLIP